MSPSRTHHGFLASSLPSGLAVLLTACSASPASGPDGPPTGDARAADSGTGEDAGDLPPADGSGSDAGPPDAITTDGPSPDAGPPPEPITATAGSWTWIDFPDSTCDDGTPTGIGINRPPRRRTC
jgi:hypothetical protein